MAEPLFGRLAEVAAEIRAAPHFLLCLDFDGTLAPIVPLPADAVIPHATRAILEALACRPDMTLAVVSGRELRDLQSRVGLDLILAGNHGLEIREDGVDVRHPQAAKWQSTVHEMCGELHSAIHEIRGALVEDKGLSASVHYRNVAEVDVEKVSELVRAVVEPNLNHFRIRHGKKVLEILPRVHWNKGSAILWIQERLRREKRQEISVCYIGDDATDEAAFREMTSGITVRVGNCPTGARFSVRNTREVYEFLRWLSSLETRPLE